MHDYTGEYAKTASEQGVWGRNCKFYAGGSQVASLSAAQAAGGNVTVSFDTINTTAANQPVHIILAKYSGTELVGMTYETVSVPYNALVDFMSSNKKFGRAVAKIARDGNGLYTIPSTDPSDATKATKVTSTVSIDPSGCTEIRAFLWSDIDDLKALAFQGTLN